MSRSAKRLLHSSLKSNVVNDILIYEVDSEESRPDPLNVIDEVEDNIEDELPPETAAVPDLLTHDNEIEEIC